MADNLERAVDANLSARKPPTRKPAASEDDPLGIDGAFDSVFGPSDLASDASDADADADSDADADADSDADGDKNSSEPQVDSEDDFGARADPNNSDDASAEDEDVGPAKQTSPHFRRDGLKIYWMDKHIGSLTQFSSSVSCHCRLHPACKTPASTTWGNDKVLIDWLLGALDAAGNVAIAKHSHIQQGAALNVRCKQQRAEQRVAAASSSRTQHVQKNKNIDYII